MRQLDSHARGPAARPSKSSAQPRINQAAAFRGAPHDAGICSGSRVNYWEGREGHKAAVRALKAQMTDEEMAIDQASHVENASTMNYRLFVLVKRGASLH